MIWNISDVSIPVYRPKDQFSLHRKMDFQTSRLISFMVCPRFLIQHSENNLEKQWSWGIPHISAYALTLEPKTAMDVMIRKNQMPGPDDDKSVLQFRFLIEYLGSHDYSHYEISNFCRPGMYSQHNSSYWKGDHYLGLGPSAHSFNGITRQWNVSAISRYSDLIHKGKVHFENGIPVPVTEI